MWKNEYDMCHFVGHQYLGTNPEFIWDSKLKKHRLSFVISLIYLPNTIVRCNEQVCSHFCVWLIKVGLFACKLFLTLYKGMPTSVVGAGLVYVKW